MKYNDNDDYDNNNNNDNNNVDGTDGTMIALTVEGMVQALNAGVHFPLGTLVPLFECLPRGVQTIMSIDLTITM
jgi:hypothetical protein